MNLLAQLQAASLHPAPKPATKGAAKDVRRLNLTLGGKAHTEKAIARYRDVMKGKGWVTQGQVEEALGYASTVSTKFIRKLFDEGYLERRNRGGKDKYDRRSGHEWRWKE